ncbi:MAG: hypothetical protein DRH49_07285 [Candidatus Coatesbacteria bacterium]|nr:MAG: hypothetical protein DRH49_07285 [Candidatus Coatesbacteria bacterium]
MCRAIKIILNKNHRGWLYFVFIIAFLVEVLISNIQCIGAQEEDVTIEPNKKIQSIIIDMVSPTKEDKEKFAGRGEEFFKAKLAELRELGGKDYEKLIPQLVYYSVYGKELLKGRVEKPDVVEAMFAGVIIEQLKISKEQIVNAILPFLRTKDEHLRKEMYNWLGGYDYNETTRSRDYSYYQSLIQAKKDNPPQGLIQYMYWRSPQTALITLMNIYLQSEEEKEIITICKDIIEEDIKNRYYGPMEEKANISPEAISSLNELSRYKQWWIHLYVAEIIKQHPEFNNPEIIERLKQDKHPLVQKVLKEVRDK